MCMYVLFSNQFRKINTLFASGKMYQCRWSECKKIYSTTSNRNRHENVCNKGEFVISPKVTSWTCTNDWCMKSFNKHYNFQQLIILCKVKEKKQFLCASCQSAYGNISNSL